MQHLIKNLSFRLFCSILVIKIFQKSLNHLIIIRRYFNKTYIRLCLVLKGWLNFQCMLKIKRVGHGSRQRMKAKPTLLDRYCFTLLLSFEAPFLAFQFLSYSEHKGCCQEDNKKWLKIRNQIEVKNQPIQLQLQPNPLHPCSSNEIITMPWVQKSIFQSKLTLVLANTKLM